jgi:hypothetical protein
MQGLHLAAAGRRAPHGGRHLRGGVAWPLCIGPILRVCRTRTRKKKRKKKKKERKREKERKK